MPLSTPLSKGKAAVWFLPNARWVNLDHLVFCESVSQEGEDGEPIEYVRLLLSVAAKGAPLEIFIQGEPAQQFVNYLNDYIGSKEPSSSEIFCFDYSQSGYLQD